MNKQTVFSRTALLAAAVTLAPALAQAHPGHNHGDFGSGMAHPLMGLDHMVAMIAVGLWAVQLGGRATWALPGAFIGSMIAGSAIGMSGVSLPYIEQGIMASVFLLGLLIAAAIRFSVVQSALLVALVALFHGYAHGAEAAASSTGISYIAGFAIATAGLHFSGIAAGLGLRAAATSAAIRLAGGAVMAVGLLVALP